MVTAVNEAPGELTPELQLPAAANEQTVGLKVTDPHGALSHRATHDQPPRDQHRAGALCHA